MRQLLVKFSRPPKDRKAICPDPFIHPGFAHKLRFNVVWMIRPAGTNYLTQSDAEKMALFAPFSVSLFHLRICFFSFFHQTGKRKKRNLNGKSRAISRTSLSFVRFDASIYLSEDARGNFCFAGFHGIINCAITHRNSRGGFSGHESKKQNPVKFRPWFESVAISIYLLHLILNDIWSPHVFSRENCNVVSLEGMR